MSTLRFTDGMEINTDGKYRVIHKSDGYYVVGHGTMWPVEDYAEGHDVVTTLRLSEKTETI